MINDGEKRRIQVYCFSDLELMEWMTTGKTLNLLCVEGVPEGARWVGTLLEMTNICFLFEHESFHTVEHGAVIPRGLIVYKTSNGLEWKRSKGLMR